MTTRTPNLRNYSVSMSQVSDSEYEGSVISYGTGMESQNGGGGGTGGGNGPSTEEVLLERETRHVCCMKTAVWVVLFLVTIVVSIAAFYTARVEEDRLFTEIYESDARILAQKFLTNIDQKVHAADLLSLVLSSYASAKVKNNKKNNESSSSSWPFVTLRDYEWQGTSVNSLAEAVGIYLVPIVPAEQRIEWEEYAKQNLHWIDDGIEFEAWKRQSLTSFRSRKQRSRSRSLQTTDSTNTTTTTENTPPLVSSTVSTNIFTVENGITVPMTEPIGGTGGNYFPLWQSSPVLPELTNYDLHTSPQFQGGLDAVVSSKMAVIGKATDIKTSGNLIGQVFQANWQETAGVYGDDPISQLYVPVWSYRPLPPKQQALKDNAAAAAAVDVNVDATIQDDAPKIVAVLVLVIFWETYFTDILSNDSPPVMAVLKNECGQVYSYEIVGPSVNYLGEGDRHDDRFNDYLFSSDLDGDDESSTKDYRKEMDTNGNYTTNNATNENVFRNGGIALNRDFCYYSLHVYPTMGTYRHFHSSKPYLLMGGVVLIFGLAAILFLFYVHASEKRQNEVMAAKKKTDTIVNELFPEKVRERMYKERAGKGDSHGDSHSGHFGEAMRQEQAVPNGDVGGEGHGDPKEFGRSSRTSSIGPTVGQQGIKASVTAVGGGGKDGGSSTMALPAAAGAAPPPPERTTTKVYDDIASAAKLGKPIADLFPQTTLFFAEVVGFDAWSSLREPSEIFMMLETLFQSFDTVAKKLNVFKVETIGATYMAVTGLPLAQPDHAVRMARFARECMHRVRDLTRSLEVELGPDTGDLRVKMGLNSGPVTAGVLKGEKSRFQLFGDTVNTAARMESLGMASRIQCSASTATLLREAGKEKWVRTREELIKAKGKGEIQTYWILPRPSSSGEDENWDMMDHDRTVPVFDMAAHIHEKQRLIDYHVELLSGHLRRIEARRREMGMIMKDPFLEEEKEVDWAHREGTTAADEVTEIIKAPTMATDGLARTPSNLHVFNRRNENKKVPVVAPEWIELDNDVLLQLRDYVTLIASMYHDNAFHNFEHATHVAMSANKLLNRLEISADDDSDIDPEYTYGMTSNPLAQFAQIFCAMIHDVDHEGVSNFQLVKEDAPIAKLYKHRSVAEQNSIDISWDLLMDPNYADLRKAIYRNEAELAHFRQIVVNIVLATDIFDNQMKNLRESRWGKAFLYEHQYHAFKEEEDDDEASNERDAPLSGKDGGHLKATIVMEHLIQASDVAHTMQHWDIYLKWNERLFQEMKIAFENGRSPNDPSLVWYEGEIIFFDKYIIPLAKKLAECGVFGVSSDECLNYAQQNRCLWAVQGESIIEGFEKNYESKRKR